MESKTFRED